MILSIIAAADENNVIGKAGTLPWHLPKDLAMFRKVTHGSPIIMGRKTYDSLPEKSRPLPDRLNIVITRDPDKKCPGCEVAGSMQSAIYAAKNVGATEAFVIGGGEIYERALPMTDKIYLTRIHARVNGDAKFPKLNPENWQEISREEHKSDDKHPYDFTFLVYQRH